MVLSDDELRAIETTEKHLLIALSGRQAALERAAKILETLGFTDYSKQPGFLSEPDIIIVYHNGETRLYDVSDVLAYADTGKPLQWRTS